MDSEVRATDKQLQQIKDWISDNAKHYWLKEKGPLKSSAEGGADIIIVDDPQMPHLIPLAKKEDPNRPVLFRSHIEVRDDLVQVFPQLYLCVSRSLIAPRKKVARLNRSGSRCGMIFKWPICSSVILSAHLCQVMSLKVKLLGYLQRLIGRTQSKMANFETMLILICRLDGLNKHLSDWDAKYHLHQLRQACDAQGAPHLAYPGRPYMTQIARFDPSKGIPDLVKSYAKFRELLKDVAADKSPQLVICGHASIDDPDGTMVYDQTVKQIHDDYPQHLEDIIVVRLGPSDQLLNAIMTMSKVALQLSTREGFEVKVSEALHKGKPIIATHAGGIPLQVQHGKSGYLVERGDHDAVAKHLYDLFTDDKLYQKMSTYAKENVSDEVHTVGNALSWLYLASTLARGESVEPNGRWLNDMAREAAGEPYEKEEPRLPRDLSTPSRTDGKAQTNGSS